jgi:multiple sugar transport system permease protein
MWKMDYDADWGIINYLLKALIPGSAPIPFLANRSTVIPALIIMDVWEWSPLMMLILLAGLQSLPVEPYEAARVDGASRWQVFANVTLPMLRGSILVAVLLRTIDALKTFDIIFISSRGGPGTASLLTSQWAYELAFVQSDIARMGYAAALSVIMFYVTIAFCNAYYRALQRVR